MRIQGALSTLTQILEDPSLDPIGKYDIVETISKLLYQNSKNQEAFLQMNGYQILLKLFQQIPFNLEHLDFYEVIFKAKT